MLMFYISLVAFGVIADCQDDVLLTPKYMYGDASSSYPLTNLADGRYTTLWVGDSTGGEYIYFYFSSEVQVKWIFIQRYYDRADYVTVWDGSTNIVQSYFGGSDEDYQTMTLRFNDVVTDQLRFYIVDSSSTPALTRLEVYGCYNTSTPTMSPTSPWPTDVPTSFPTVSPTLPPVSIPPSISPSDSPSTSPSLSPTMTNPSLYPSTGPTSSPTEPPTDKTVIPSRAPTYSPTTVLPTNHPSGAPSPAPTLNPSVKTVLPSPNPTASPTTMLPTFKPSVAPSPSPTVEPTVAAFTPSPSTSPSSSPTEPPTVVYADDGFKVTLSEIEFFVIAIFCLCGVLIFVAVRYQRLMKLTENLNSTEERMIKIYNTDHSAEQKMIELDEDPIRNDAINITRGSCTPGNIEIGPQDSAR